MDKLIVACVQPRMRVFDTIEEYIDDLRRYINVALHQQANLIVFPELLGLMIAPALMDTSRLRVTSKNGPEKKSRRSILNRARRPFLAAFGTNLSDGINEFLQTNAVYVSQIYAEIFGGYAREYGITIVGPSGYLADPLDGTIRNMAGVFSSDGDQLGYQSKMKLSSVDKGLVKPGQSWNVIQTDVGAMGLVLGEDVFYPDVCELLAMQGAELLVFLAACDQPVTSNRVRSNAIMRVQETQLYGVLSYIVGENVIAKKQRGLFTGNSAIISSPELTINNDSIFIEIAESNNEGVITAELEFEALMQLHSLSNRPTYATLSVREKRQMIANIEEQMLQPLAPNFDFSTTEKTATQEEKSTVQAHQVATDIYTLDQLPIAASISARWPLMPLIDIIEPVVFEEFQGSTDEVTLPPLRVKDVGSVDDETEEMDALFIDSDTPVDGD